MYVYIYIYIYILNKKYIISLSLLQNAHYNLRVSGLDINSKKEKKRLKIFLKR